MVAAAVVVGSSRPVPAGPGDHGDGERCRRGREVPDQHEVVQGLPGATVEEPGLVQSAAVGVVPSQVGHDLVEPRGPLVVVGPRVEHCGDHTPQLDRAAPAEVGESERHSRPRL